MFFIRKSINFNPYALKDANWRSVYNFRSYKYTSCNVFSQPNHNNNGSKNSLTEWKKAIFGGTIRHVMSYREPLCLLNARYIKLQVYKFLWSSKNFYPFCIFLKNNKESNFHWKTKNVHSEIKNNNIHSKKASTES